MSDARDLVRAALAILARSEIEPDAARREELLGLARNSMAAAVGQGAGYGIATLASELEKIGLQTENEQDSRSVAA